MFTTAKEMAQNIHGHAEGPRCDCGVPAIKRTSRTDKNPNRDFYVCSRDRCKYWKWADQLVPQQPSIPSPPSTPSSSATQESNPPSPQARIVTRREELDSAAMPAAEGLSRVPSTPTTRRTTSIQQVVQLPPTPVTGRRNKVQPQTPEQRARRLAEIQQAKGESQGSASHGGVNNHISSASPQNGQRPLEGIDKALSEARVNKPGASPLKRTHSEVSEDEDQYWKDAAEPPVVRPNKISRSSAQDIELFGGSNKGKGREVPVPQAGPSRLPSDPENPFEVREEAASTQGTLTPPATPSTSGRADAMEDRIRDFQSFVAEYRKLERKLRASERSIAARDKTIDTLKETVEAQEKIVKAQKAQIAALKEDNEDLKNNVAHLGTIIEGRRVHRRGGYD
ncbi:hypothetical protein BC629DRAFT_1560532 [Irpex lacteus]|nr:hypothetical protein BC629DRAFT_1560532 [Irpex lacteus]